MDGPFDAEENKTIYNDKATNSGETERFLALSKFFYEHLMPSSQTHLSEPMRADVIIGNDWQTGGIAAMLRYLTPAREAHGLNNRFAERLQNTPVMTLMHNFKLRGAAYHSQEKLLNMMFGEHAAKIVENAYAPNGAELSPHLLNTLFAGDGINPQTMAMNFSDYVPFVSVGNFTEASTDPARGGLNYEIAALRGRQGKYSDSVLLRRIAAINDINPDEISAMPTAGGITNGCDRINNIISKEKARAVEMFLGLETGSLMTAEDVERLNAEGKNGAYIVHQNNKRVNLERVVDDIKLAKETNGAINPMKLMDIENTDLTGVDENTMVVGMAGRIVDQKGVDIEAAGILEYYKAGNFDHENPPVFYIQGTGNMKYIQPFLNAKAEVAKINKRAADRMVFANLFSEPGRYDACKMFSDFSSMPSWDEPCGLVHKEIAYASGAIPIVNKTGGLRDGLYEYGQDGENAIFVDFKDKDNNPIEEALPYNAQGFSRGLVAAQEWYRDKGRFEKGIESSFNGQYDWLGGKIQQYVDVLKQRGVIKE
jgi:glycogen synthase